MIGLLYLGAQSLLSPTRVFDASRLLGRIHNWAMTLPYLTTALFVGTLAWVLISGLNAPPAPPPHRQRRDRRRNG